MTKEISAEAAYEEVKLYRKNADGIETSYFVQGREAQWKLTVDVYTLFRKALRGGAEGERLFTILKTQLQGEKKTLKANSTAASVIVRYVFKHYTDAQVSKTSTVMNYCDSKGIDDLVAFVKENKGLEGVRAMAVKEAGTGKAKEAAAMEVVAASRDTQWGAELLCDSDNIAHIEVNNWVEGE
jgi:hypothetical protein